VLHSEPPGTIDDSAYVSNNTVVTTPDMQQSDFGYWTLDGSRQADAWGVALRQLAFLMTTNDREGVAWLFSGDIDGDGVDDAIEHSYYGSLTNDADSDTDSDGLTFANDPHPVFHQSSDEGGISWLDSPPVTVNLQFFPRVAESLVDGLALPFFSLDTSTTGTFSIAANSHPALGDWDGDGDLDLFVGGFPGRMRVFENQGSPVVLNLVEQTPNFAGIEDCWLSISNPAPALGDWNGDGLDDLAIGGDANELWLVESWGTFASNEVSGFSVHGSGVPAFAEINGDGAIDLLVLTEAGRVQVHLNTDTPLPRYPDTPSSTDLLPTPVPNARGISTADVNDDGRLDILISDQSGHIWEFHSLP